MRVAEITGAIRSWPSSFLSVLPWLERDARKQGLGGLCCCEWKAEEDDQWREREERGERADLETDAGAGGRGRQHQGGREGK